jgi:hypothetical protein
MDNEIEKIILKKGFIFGKGWNIINTVLRIIVHLVQLGGLYV